MPVTPTYGFRYPAVTDPPNVPLDMQELATDIEAKFVTVDATVAATKVLSNTPITANSSNTSGTTKVIWVSRTVSLVNGLNYRVVFDTGYDAAAASTIVFEMHYIAGGSATLTGATKFYGRYQRAHTGGAFLNTSGSKVFTAPSTGTFTIMGALWNVDSSVSKTNGGTPNATDNNGVFLIEQV
ncbi:hypothetical protein ACWEF6_01960 [Amycolatopsis sp. NPDC004772]